MATEHLVRVFSLHPWSSTCALVLECSLRPVSLLLPPVLFPPLPDSCGA